MTEVSCQEVLKLIQKIPVNKATGVDNISAYLLKEAVPIIASSLTYIINLSVRSGIFPNAWKIAKVTTIFKEGLKSDPNNCDPPQDCKAKGESTRTTRFHFKTKEFILTRFSTLAILPH